MKLNSKLAQLASKGFWYWFRVFCLIALGMMVGNWLEKQHVAMEVRYRIYQFMQRFSPHKGYAQRTVLVLIGDEEYWKGEPARRSPIKRDYLAKLISALDKADPTLIALDFDLRSQLPDERFEHTDYKDETDKLLKTVKEVAAQRPIVLPKTIKFTRDGYYVPEADIYDGYDFQTGNVAYGYIILPYDYRRIPLSLYMKDGATVESFAEAIVRKDNEGALRTIKKGAEFPYGSYLDADDFTKVYASEVLNPTPETFRKLRDKVVIIGADWSKAGYRRGGKVDTRFTPVGEISGVYMHANYVEALLGNRTYGHWREAVLKVGELLLTLALAVIFALAPKGWKRPGLVLLLCLFLAVLSYLSWLNLGRFFDFFVPMLLIIGHAIFEQIREWRNDARKYHNELAYAGSAEVEQ